MTPRLPVVRINRPLDRPIGGEGSGDRGHRWRGRGRRATPCAATASTWRVRTPLERSGCGAPASAPGLRIGLLGGSFNPAHEGHVAVSIEALRQLRLDKVVWLISPQNPLKPRDGMASFAERVEAARRIARHPGIEVSDLEQRLGTRYTIDTIRALQRNRRDRHVWLIGADNLIQLPRWKGWQEIVDRLPIAVFDREPYSYEGLAREVARRFAWARRSEAERGALADAEPPAWAFVRFRRHAVSSTALRRRQAEDEEETPF